MTTDNELRGARELAAEARSVRDHLQEKLVAPPDCSLSNLVAILFAAWEESARCLDAVEAQRREAVELLRHERGYYGPEDDHGFHAPWVQDRRGEWCRTTEQAAERCVICAFLARVEEES